MHYTSFDEFINQIYGCGFADSLDGFRQSLLKESNLAREKYRVGPLKPNSELNQTAQSYAEHLAKKQIIEHSHNANMGENLFMQQGSKPEASEVIKSWVDSEVPNYNWNNPGFSMQTGHFTQCVWKDTTDIGIGLANKGNDWYVVANYRPAGNVGDRQYFRENVLQPDPASTQSNKLSPTKGSPDKDWAYENPPSFLKLLYRRRHGMN